jgi:hypothetical protein
MVLTLACSLLLVQSSYAERVEAVRKTPGFAALWDFVKRDADGRFDAWQREPARDFRLDAVNYVRDYWNLGRAATYVDFPLLGEGPFGNAVGFRAEQDPDFRPVLLVPRARLHGSPIDVRGPGRSVSMVVWLSRTSGNHAIAGIWHEGTDHAKDGVMARRIERGQRQYALFAGLAANNGAGAAHVSENGAASFGDRYARNLAVTPDVIPQGWNTVGFVFDNDANTVTAYLNGKADAYWIEDPQKHPFFQWPARGWAEGCYRPPEDKPRRVRKISKDVEVQEYEFTKVRVNRQNGRILNRELAAIRANPYWFPHDLYMPPSAERGGPFTIGRVIHMSRNVGFVGWIGGVAVFDRALSRGQMARLGRLARTPITQQRP